MITTSDYILLKFACFLLDKRKFSISIVFLVKDPIAVIVIIHV